MQYHVRNSNYLTPKLYQECWVNLIINVIIRNVCFGFKKNRFLFYFRRVLSNLTIR